MTIVLAGSGSAPAMVARSWPPPTSPAPHGFVSHRPVRDFAGAMLHAAFNSITASRPPAASTASSGAIVPSPLPPRPARRLANSAAIASVARCALPTNAQAVPRSAPSAAHARPALSKACCAVKPRVAEAPDQRASRRTRFRVRRPELHAHAGRRCAAADAQQPAALR